MAEAGVESFSVRVEEARRDDLRRRLATVRDAPPVLNGRGGIGPDELTRLIDFWRDEFEWEALEAELDRYDSGARAGDAFDVVVAELPGFGWSTLPQGAVEPSRIADLLAEALRRLGINRYGLVGGNIGGLVLQFLAARHPGRVIGIHTHHPSLHPPIHDGAPLSEVERVSQREAGCRPGAR